MFPNKRKKAEEESKTNRKRIKLEKAVEWSSDDVAEWVKSLGSVEVWTKMAKEFVSYDIDGPTLLSLNIDDLESTLGKGLGTKRIWKEVEKLQARQNKMPEPGAEPTVPAPRRADVEKMEVEEKRESSVTVYRMKRPVSLLAKPETIDQKLEIMALTLNMLVEVERVDETGIAYVVSPKKGCFSLMGDDLQNVAEKVCILAGRVFARKQKVFQEEDKSDLAKFKINLGLLGLENNVEYVLFHQRATVYRGGAIKGLKTHLLLTDENDIVLLQERQNCGFYDIPELLCMRSTKNIAFNLFRQGVSVAWKKPLSFTLCEDLRKAFENKAKGAYIVTDQKAFMKAMGGQGNYFVEITFVADIESTFSARPMDASSVFSKSASEEKYKKICSKEFKKLSQQNGAKDFIIKFPTTISSFCRRLIHIAAKENGLVSKSINVPNPKHFERGARQLFVATKGVKLPVDAEKYKVVCNTKHFMNSAHKKKDEAQLFVSQTRLANINGPAVENRLGLVGNIGSNLDRVCSPIVRERDLSLLVRGNETLKIVPDKEYQVYRQFLRYSDALMSVVGTALNKAFDDDVIDAILAFLDDGSHHYMTNAKGSTCFQDSGSKCLDFYSTFKGAESIYLNKNLCYFSKPMDVCKTRSSKSVVKTLDNNVNVNVVRKSGDWMYIDYPCRGWICLPSSQEKYHLHKPELTEFCLDSETLEKMWAEHAETALRLMFQLGATREGKQDLASFYCCMKWLWDNHPFSLLNNLEHVANINYYKAMLEVLNRATENNELIRTERNATYKSIKGKFKKKTVTNSEEKKTDKILLSKSFRAKHIYPGQTKMTFSCRVLEMYDRDLLYRALHKRIAKIFAKHLRRDLNRNGQSLAAKWCPSQDSSYDKRTLLHEAVCREMFPPTLKEYANMTELDYTRAIRNRLRRQVLTPLRSKGKIVETLLSSGRVKEINYEHVPGQCMRKHKKTFEKLDPEGFQQYLDKVTKGKAKVSVGAATPFSLFKDVTESGDPSKDALANGQWKTMMKTLVKKIPQDQRNIVAAIDVSGSMGARLKDGKGTCIDVAKAMGLVCTELSEGSYKDTCILFTTDARTVNIKGESVSERANDLNRQCYSGGTSFMQIFDEVINNIPKYGLPHRIIILSDMEFSHGGVGASPWQKVREKFKQALGTSEHKENLDQHVPEVVFWNINNHGTPTRKTEVGAAMVTGYSANAFVDVLCNAKDRGRTSGKNDPLVVVLNALHKPCFRYLRVVKTKQEGLELLRNIYQIDEEELADKDEEMETCT